MADVERAADILLYQKDAGAGLVDLHQLVEDEVNEVRSMPEQRTRWTCMNVYGVPPDPKRPQSLVAAHRKSSFSLSLLSLSSDELPAKATLPSLSE